MTRGGLDQAPSAGKEREGSAEDDPGAAHALHEGDERASLADLRPATPPVTFAQSGKEAAYVLYEGDKYAGRDAAPVMPVGHVQPVVEYAHSTFVRGEEVGDLVKTEVLSMEEFKEAFRHTITDKGVHQRPAPPSPSHQRHFTATQPVNHCWLPAPPRPQLASFSPRPTFQKAPEPRSAGTVAHRFVDNNRVLTPAARVHPPASLHTRVPQSVGSQSLIDLHGPALPQRSVNYAAYGQPTHAMPAMPARYAEYVPAPSQPAKYADGTLVATEVLTMAEFKQKFPQGIAIKEVETRRREIGQDMFGAADGATSLPVRQPTSRIPFRVSQSIC